MAVKHIEVWSCDLCHKEQSEVGGGRRPSGWIYLNVEEKHICPRCVGAIEKILIFRMKEAGKEGQNSRVTDATPNATL